MLITEKDIGRKVKCIFNGDEGIIESINNNEITFKVNVLFGDILTMLTINGKYWADDKEPYIEFVDINKKMTDAYEELINNTTKDLIVELKSILCQHPRDQVITNIAAGNKFKYCRKCKNEVIDNKELSYDHY